jgi:hypothetical protein
MWQTLKIERKFKDNPPCLDASEASIAKQDAGVPYFEHSAVKDTSLNG